VDAVLATSEAVAKATGVETTVVYPGVELSRRVERVPRSGPPKVGTVARLEPIKHIDELLKATASIRARHPNLQLEIVGTGSCEDRLRELARSLGIQDSVQFLGWRTDPSEAHRTWDAFAIPSQHEGFGLAALEAMASGLPVVGSATGGLPELIEEGTSGFLVPPGDTTALAQRISQLISEPKLRAKMGETAQARAGNFSVAEMSRRIEMTYDHVLRTDSRA
jgi:glycosyltransferase involved in cell wall biosynthesis